MKWAAGAGIPRDEEMSDIIYLDNAAGSHPKPESVYIASDRVLRRGGNPGRSAHNLALAASKEIFECRLEIAEYLGIDAPERLIFTAGCTQSLNMVLCGTDFKEGDLVCVSALEHNALMRPLQKLRRTRGIEISVMPYCPGSILDVGEFERFVAAKRPRLCAFLHASNVSGEILPIEEVSDICARFETALLIDGAQTAGVFQAAVGKLSYWCASAHKSLYGAPGLGLLYVNPAVDLEPFVLGGTGSNSEQMDMPLAYPDRLEAGSMAAPAIAALSAGVRFLKETGREKIAQHEMQLCRRFLNWLSERKQFEVAAAGVEKRSPVVSFRSGVMDSSYIAERLDREFGICVRAGLHCAASAHRALGTLETGLVRVSFGYFNTEEEVDILLHALESISETHCK